MFASLKESRGKTNSKKSSLGHWGWVEAWGDWLVVSIDLFVSISVRFCHFL